MPEGFGVMRRQTTAGIFQRKRWEKSYGKIPEKWSFVPLGSLFNERKQKSSDQEKYPLYSFTIENSVTPKTDRYERSFLLKDNKNNKFSLVYNSDFVLNPMNLRFGAIGMSRVKLPVLVSAYYNILIPNKEKIDFLYMEIFLKSSRMIDLYDKIAIGSLVEKRRVHLSIFNTTYIPLPPLKEQIYIGNVIEKFNCSINLTERLIAAKQELRKGLMQQLLTEKRRMTGCSSPWKTMRLGEIFINRIESNRAELPLLAITGDRGVIPRNEVERKDSSNADKSRYLRICPRDIGYNTMRMWQGVSALSSLEGIVSPAYTVVTPQKNVDGEFMALFFRFSPTIHLFFRYSQGLVSDTLNLKFNNFAKIQVKIPEKPEQEEIVKVFKKLDNEIGLLKQVLDAVHEQKKGLIQQLITGKIRVKVPEAAEN